MHVCMYVSISLSPFRKGSTTVCERQREKIGKDVRVHRGLLTTVISHKSLLHAVSVMTFSFEEKK